MNTGINAVGRFLACIPLALLGPDAPAAPTGPNVQQESGYETRKAEELPPEAFGTCFAVSPIEVITSNHIVDAADSISVEFLDKIRIPADIVQQSVATDLALLRIQEQAPAYLPLAPVRSLNIGEQVFTIGYPVMDILGSDAKFTEGSVSSLSGIRNDVSYFQMSVPVQPGNSGGPVANMRGEVVGVVSSTAAVAEFYSVSGSLPQNINWAAKSDYARLLFDPPAMEFRAASRGEAISMVSAATCRIRVLRN